MKWDDMSDTVIIWQWCDREKKCDLMCGLLMVINPQHYHMPSPLNVAYTNRRLTVWINRKAIHCDASWIRNVGYTGSTQVVHGHTCSTIDDMILIYINGYHLGPWLKSVNINYSICHPHWSQVYSLSLVRSGGMSCWYQRHFCRGKVRSCQLFFNFPDISVLLTTRTIHF